MLSLRRFTQVTLRESLIMSKSGKSKPPSYFGPIMVLCLVFTVLFRTNCMQCRRHARN